MTAKPCFLVLLTLVVLPLRAPAQTNQGAAGVSAPTPQVNGVERTLQDIKKPVSWLTWGADFRARNEYFDNLLTLNPYHPLHEQDYFRFRGRVWASVTPFEDLSLNARLANEAREWMRPAGYTGFAGQSGMDWRDGIFDNLNVQWRHILAQPASLTVGRQDVFLGDGWLVGDGTPFDGSWTYFLDAARLTWGLKDQHTTIEVLGIMQDAHDNAWLQTINANQYLPETEQNEKGAILWVANKSLVPANFDGYFMYKHDNAANDIAPKFHPDTGDIYTLGGRVSGAPGQHWKYSAEGAYQFGRKRDPSIQFPASSMDFHDLDAFGVNSKLTWLFKDRLNNQLNLSYEFLSGDDPKTGDDEMFDNLWGRWPRWSETGLYSFAAETRIGNEANLHRFGPGWSFTPLKNLDFSASYFALFTAEKVATRGPTSLFTGAGNFRGHFVQAVLKYKVGKHMNAHLWSEFQFPGDYYVYRQPWKFLRAEVMFIF